jgi:beta-glucosidase
MYPVYSQADRATWPLYASSGDKRIALGMDVNSVATLPSLKVETAQVNTQQDGKLVTWTGPGRLEARGAKAIALPAFAATDGALQFDTIVNTAPKGKATVSIGAAAFDASALFRSLVGKKKQTVRIPLSCFTAKGADLANMDTPFAVASDSEFAAAFANIQIVGGAAKEKDAVSCAEGK